MCGIFGIINYDKHKIDKINKNFIKGSSRGPEYSVIKTYNNNCFGFHRLAINGLNIISNQPFEINNIVLICNGEIYNYKELAKDNNINLITDSDCEIILHLYLLYGIEYTLGLLDGVFAFILYDKNNNSIFLSRDPYGVRPLYISYENNSMYISSELKSIYNLSTNKKSLSNFIPGYYMKIDIYNYNITYNYTKYTNFPFYDNTIFNLLNIGIYNNLYNKLTNAVKKRIIGTTERPVACLLSGGLDSSLICALVNKIIKKENPDIKLQTFCIGMPDSEDLKYAKIVAQHLDTHHHEIILTEDEFFNAIPEVIRIIESYDTTTIRASVGNYLVSKYIKENTDCKVIFNGDGADELMGGYLYFKKTPNANEFDRECKRLLNDIYMYDVLRSDKSISSNGLEPRTPFLDRAWVDFYLSIDKNIRFNTTIEKCEKYLMRKAVDCVDKELLPESILWRTKEAFSDGVSKLNKSWYEIIQEKIELMCKEDLDLKNELELLIKTYKNYPLSNNNPKTMEQAYYRYIYNKHYKDTDHLIHYYWMPKYIDAKDCSARTLKHYGENNSNM